MPQQSSRWNQEASVSVDSEQKPYSYHTALGLNPNYRSAGQDKELSHA